MTHEKKVEILKAAHMSDDTIRHVMNEGMYEIYNLEDFEGQFGQGLRVWWDILGLDDEDEVRQYEQIKQRVNNLPRGANVPFPRDLEDWECVTVDGCTYFVKIYDSE